MAAKAGANQPFDIVIVAQAGRLAYEALLFAASLKARAPGFGGRLFVAEPQPGPLWPTDPRVPADLRAAIEEQGAMFVPFESRLFGAAYPHGNKIEALSQLPTDGAFLFFDSDTIILNDLAALEVDFIRPTASMRRGDTWPKEALYGPDRATIWKSLYDRFGLDFVSSQDPNHPDGHWERYLYFNAGWFLGPSAKAFGDRFAQMALSIRDDPPEELAAQSLDPWLDQVALPLVIHALGGGRPDAAALRLDDDLACHWRVLPLFYARAPDRAVEILHAVAAPNRIKKHLKGYAPFRRMLYQGKGIEARALFDRADLPRSEAEIRKRLKAKRLWLR